MAWRSFVAMGDSASVAGTSITSDPAAEMGCREASVLRHLLDGMDPDVQNRRHAAYEWAQARERRAVTRRQPR
jgi:hypothetical protein